MEQQVFGGQTDGKGRIRAIKGRRVRLFKGSVIYVLHTDDSVIAGPHKRGVDAVIEEIRLTKLDITVEGDIRKFLGVGVSIERKDDGSIEFSLRHVRNDYLE